MCGRATGWRRVHSTWILERCSDCRNELMGQEEQSGAPAAAQG